jgi:hypothetical protein
MAASEHSGSQNLELAEWPVWRKLIDRSGSAAVVAWGAKRSLTYISG